MKDMVTILKELTDAPGVPGQEQEVRELMRSYLEPLTDEIQMDNLGSIIGRKTGTAGGPKIMLMGHMDEVGFMVSHVSKEGFISFQPLGGWWSQVLLAQRVLIKSRKGDFVGVIGSKPPHLLTDEEGNKVVEKKTMFIDIGAKSKEHVKELGIRLGDPIVPICPFTVMADEKLYMAKAFDNRAGCLIAVETLKSLQDVNHPNVVYSGATVQEEVGLRGAQTSTTMINPDVYIALDVTCALDTPGIEAKDDDPKAGLGPVVVLYDSSMITNTKLRDLFIDTAEEEGIPYQVEIFSGEGGTDAGTAHMTGHGVPSINIGIATRYIHSHASVIHHDDLENTVKLLAAVLKKLDQKTVDWIKS